LIATPREAKQRLFFALWPEAADREALVAATARAVRHCGGRPVPESNLHVTLAFLGSVAQARVPELREIAARCAAGFPAALPLSLYFAQLVHWPRQEILCAVTSDEPAAPALLATGLKDATAAAGFAPDLKPFRAHVTVARKVLRFEAQAFAPVEWRFERFALIDSRTDRRGPVYSVVEFLPLVKAAKARE
jgi:RNA 2',3'-cyclic 3'-phosphodiesterase